MELKQACEEKISDYPFKCVRFHSRVEHVHFQTGLSESLSPISFRNHY